MQETQYLPYFGSEINMFIIYSLICLSTLIGPKLCVESISYGCAVPNCHLLHWTLN